MSAVIETVGTGFHVRLERRLEHAVKEVWSWLTENGKLSRWFPELRVENLREGGLIMFDMQNGTFEQMEITKLISLSVLEYTWDEDRVRFELYPDHNGCRLVFTEELNRVTEHTPRDIAGWDVCLDVIEALMDGREIVSRKDIWQSKYERYAKVFKEL